MGKTIPFVRSRKAKVTALGTALVLLGAGTAVAATLTFTLSNGAGAGDAAVSSCDSSITLALGTPSYSASLPGYEISTVAYSNVDSVACSGATLRVTVADGSDVSLGSGSSAISGASGTITLSTPVSAADASTVYGVIS